LLEQLAGTLQVTEDSAGQGEAVHRCQGGVVVLAEYPPAGGEGLLGEVADALEVAERPVDLCEVVDRPQGVGDMLPGRGSRGPEVSECRSVKAFTG
jgi:hypothetical protein